MVSRCEVYINLNRTDQSILKWLIGYWKQNDFIYSIMYWFYVLLVFKKTENRKQELSRTISDLFVLLFDCEIFYLQPSVSFLPTKTYIYNCSTIEIVEWKNKRGTDTKYWEGNFCTIKMEKYIIWQVYKSINWKQIECKICTGETQQINCYVSSEKCYEFWFEILFSINKVIHYVCIEIVTILKVVVKLFNNNKKILFPQFLLYLFS